MRASHPPQITSRGEAGCGAQIRKQPTCIFRNPLIILAVLPNICQGYLCSHTLMPLGKAKLGWQNLLEHYGMVQPYTSHGMVQPGTSGLGALCYCLSATLYGTNIKAESSSTTALCRGIRSVSRLLLEESSPACLIQPSPSLLTKERAHWPQLAFHSSHLARCWSLAGTSTNHVWPLREAPKHCHWDVAVSKGVRVRASMCSYKCVSMGHSNIAALLATHQR